MQVCLIYSTIENANEAMFSDKSQGISAPQKLPAYFKSGNGSKVEDTTVSLSDHALSLCLPKVLYLGYSGRAVEEGA